MKAITFIYRMFITIGIDLQRMYFLITGIPSYLNDLYTLKKQIRDNDFPITKLSPCLDDKHKESGSHKGHYFHQDLLVARRVFINNPLRHVDIGSRIDGFVAHVASFRAIEVIDIRPLAIDIQNIQFIQADLLQLESNLYDICDSVSCLHAIEHIGLGRYGDTIMYDGYLQGLNNISKILKTGGKLYLSVPIGRQRIEFNAHRVFSLNYIFNLLSKQYKLEYFSYVDDRGVLYENALLLQDNLLNNFNCNYGCGIFELTKI